MVRDLKKFGSAVWPARLCFSLCTHSDTGAPLHEERVMTVRKKPNVHLELYQRDVTGGMRTPDRVLWQPARDTSRAFDAGDTKDSFNEMLVKMPNSTTQINAARPERVKSSPWRS